MNNAVSERTMKNVRKNGDVKLLTTKRRKTIWFQNQIIILQSFSQKTY